MRSMLVSFVLLASGLAQANDGGIAHIDVKGINPGGVKSGSTIKFYGKDAHTFMRLLPAFNSVDLGMVSPDFAKLWIKNQRTLLIASPAWALSFSCKGGNVDLGAYNERGRFENPTYTPYSNGAECEIKIEKDAYAIDTAGDSWDMIERDYEENVCK